MAPVTQRLRQGDLLEAVAELEPDIRAIVIGKRGEAADFATGHVGSNMERIVRASRVPVLVASRAFRPIGKVLVAFDASRSAGVAIERMAASPCVPRPAGDAGPCRRDRGPTSCSRMEAARDRLRAAGLAAETRVVPGEPEAALQQLVEAEGFDLLVMGAYGHSRLRSLIIGSTTTAMIQACRVPVLLYR